MDKRRQFLAVTFLIPLIAAALGPFQVGDLAVWVAHGLASLERGEILRHDVFSVLPTEPLVYPAWAISIVYGLIYRLGGLLSIAYFHIAAALLLIWLIYRSSIWKISEPSAPLVRVAVYFSWLGSLVVVGTRPNTLALIPFFVSFLMISRIESFQHLTKRKILLLSLIATIWANLHGSFVLLPLLLTWKLVVLLIRDFFCRIPLRANIARSLVSVSSVFTSTLLNPFGLQVYPYVLTTSKYSRERHITEWMSTTIFRDFPLGVSFYILAGGILWILYKRLRAGRFLETLSSPMIPLIALGFTAIRNAALPFVVLLPTLFSWGFLQSWGEFPKSSPMEPDGRLRKTGRLAFLGVMLVAAVVSLMPQLRAEISPLLPKKNRQMFDEDAIPGIAAWIRESGQNCPIFNSWSYGSYLMLSTRNRIFIDTRNIIYSQEQFKILQSVIGAQPGWQAYLKKYGACFAVIDEYDNGIFIEAALQSGNWRKIMTERGAVLLERVRPEK
ncbi:hypothetical protein EBZ37_01360 [bacterium]|nr:hypothetical protein [bacterium]